MAGLTLVCNPSVIFESAAGSLLCVIILCFSGIWVSLSSDKKKLEGSIENNITTVTAIKVEHLQIILKTSTFNLKWFLFPLVITEVSV